jgi:hypothetical protein
MDIQIPVNQHQDQAVQLQCKVNATYCTGQKPVNITKKIQIFINSCLRMVLRIPWPDKISNKELWQRTNQKSADVEISQRRWRRVGHIYVNQQATLQMKPPEKEKEVQATKHPCVEISRKMQRRQTTHGHSWRDSHRIEKA